MLTAYAKGIGTGAGLIIAIGAQNAFVLSQGVRKNHYLTIALICALCDAILVAVGVTGVGTMFAASPLLTRIAGMGGAAFLFVYGARAFQSAFRGNQMETDNDAATSLKAVVLATLAVTLLNPHVYIDTVLLLGSIASQFQPPEHLAFGAGAVTASFAWFFSLSIGATFLAPLFRKKRAWQILDSFVGVVMWTIAASLVRGVAV
ncbi:MAG TPA: amino acid transporter [Desulfobacteraceae bacterium]|nr:amino acid transporter [Desulfobacteraceae bacterium]|tara:strand:- start:518 stop:1129 length:612 start_codon:yes stop_codon:yes gene_type:complete